METNRLIFIEPSIDYIEDYVELRNQEFFLQFNPMPTISKEEGIKEITKFIENKGVFFLIDKETGKMIGSVESGTDVFRHGVKSEMISYFLGQQYARKGYMYEALREFINYLFMFKEADIVSARVFDSNLASKALLQKLNFKHEGTLRHAIDLKRGKILNDCFFSITKDEFIKHC